MTSEGNIVNGSGFHCKLSINLKEIRSIRRCAFWGGGWWYSCESCDAKTFDIHVKSEVDLIKLFKEFKDNENT